MGVRGGRFGCTGLWDVTDSWGGCCCGGARRARAAAARLELEVKSTCFNKKTSALDAFVTDFLISHCGERQLNSHPEFFAKLPQLFDLRPLLD